MKNIFRKLSILFFLLMLVACDNKNLNQLEDNKEYTWQKTEEIGEKQITSEIDLDKIELEEPNLEETNLEETNLEETNLEETNLEEPKEKKVILPHAIEKAIDGKIESILYSGNEQITICMPYKSEMTQEEIMSQSKIICEEILSHEEFDEKWNVLVVDYNDFGYVTISKKDVIEDERRFKEDAYVFDRNETYYEMLEKSVEYQQKNHGENQLSELDFLSYIGNKSSKKFHVSSCGTLPEQKNRISLSSRDEAINEGYDPCKNCNP